jgi:hypothetical protein
MSAVRLILAWDCVHVTVLPDNHICVTTKIGMYGVDERLVFLEMESEKVGSIIPTSCFREPLRLSAEYFDGAINVVYLSDGRFVLLFRDAIEVIDFDAGD